jgi:nucleoside-diphosphate-sugar epimerase
VRVRVLVTGGSGFVGSHAVRALREAGHELRLLVRDPEKATRVLGARVAGAVELVRGDVTDAASVGAALAGCDAVLHAAAAVEIGRASAVLEQNRAANRNVLGQAAERGLDPIVYVSSVIALFPPRGPVFSVDDPVASLATAYGRSKAEGETLARELQARGAPVAIVYPAGVYGPHDPGPGVATRGLVDRLRFGWPITSGGSACVDVRDLGRLLAAAVRPGRGPRRYMAGGHFLGWAEEAALCERLTGRRVRRVPAPPALVRGAGHVVDLLQRLVPSFSYPLTHEAAVLLTRFVPCDSDATLAELGVRFRPTGETLADAIRWLVTAGHLAPRYAGRLAPRPEPVR